MSGNLDETAFSSQILPEKAKKRWRLIQNVLKAVILLKRHDTKVMTNLDQLLEEIKLFPNSPENKKKRNSNTSDCIAEHKIQDKLFYLIRRSNSEDLEQINKLIGSHPRRFCRANIDPNSIVNKADFFGVRPLYEACKHGYHRTVELLINQGADPHLVSHVNSEEETVLEVSCRWNHLMVVSCLLSRAKWSNNELKAAIKKTKNKNVEMMLRDSMSSRRCLWFC